MNDMTFRNFKAAVESALPGARVYIASAMADMAVAHENQFHLCGLNRALAHAWRTLACECPDATDAHRDAQLNCEVEFDDEDRGIGQLWLPILRKRLDTDAPPGLRTGTIAPNDEDFIEAWLRHHQEKGSGDHQRDGWAGALLWEWCDGDLHTGWEMTQCLLKHHTTDWQLTMLGCGPLEDMLWKHAEDAVNLIAPSVPGARALSYALAHVWIGDDKPRGAHIRQYWAQRLAELGVKAEPRPAPFLAI